MTTTPNKEGTMKVRLAHASNPDIRGGYWGEKPTVKAHSVTVTTLDEASKVCRDFIEKYELGGGNWTGGQVEDNNKVVAQIAYNGRIIPVG
jgi:hypothetical protein